MEIFKITCDIASAASQIYALSWKSAYRNIVPQKYLDDLSFERWTPFLQDSPSIISFVVKDNGEYVATSSISAARDDKMKGWGEIISIYVLPRYFGKGYGRELLTFVVDQLHCRVFWDIYLWVLEENQQARRFYEQNGFTADGEKTTVEIGGKELVEVRYVHSRSHQNV